MRKYRYLVTSGCSFSDNSEGGRRWPYYLAEIMDAKLYNRGHGSAGNDWICKSIIYQVSELLDSGIQPSEIIVVVMWSGIDRNSIFISSRETKNYESFINPEVRTCNPVNFVYSEYSKVPESVPIIKSGWLLGSMGCSFHNENINKLKQEYGINFLNKEWLAINSVHNYLELQWFCKATGIRLINQTYMNTWYYPDYPYDMKNDNSQPAKYIKTSEYFSENIKHLYNLLDLNNWVFTNCYGEYDGLFEYTKFNELGFYDDALHPLPESHKHYVDNFLYNKIIDLTRREKMNDKNILKNDILTTPEQRELMRSYPENPKEELIKERLEELRKRDPFIYR